eukprot:752837-Hanusia_phi.AAC.3
MASSAYIRSDLSSSSDVLILRAGPVNRRMIGYYYWATPTRKPGLQKLTKAKVKSQAFRSPVSLYDSDSLSLSVSVRSAAGSSLRNSVSSSQCLAGVTDSGVTITVPHGGTEFRVRLGEPQAARLGDLTHRTTPVLTGGVTVPITGSTVVCCGHSLSEVTV